MARRSTVDASCATRRHGTMPIVPVSNSKAAAAAIRLRENGLTREIARTRRSRFLYAPNTPAVVKPDCVSYADSEDSFSSSRPYAPGCATRR